MKNKKQKTSDEIHLIRIVENPIIPDDDFEKEWREIPRFVIFLCKILDFILTYAGFAFMIVGGILSLIWASSLWKLCAANGWRGLLNIETLYIVSYLVILIVIDRVRFLLFKIINRI